MNRMTHSPYQFDEYGWSISYGVHIMDHMRWYFSSTFISISICSILEFYSENFYSFQQMGRVAISGEDVVVVSSNFSPMASLSSI